MFIIICIHGHTKAQKLAAAHLFVIAVFENHWSPTDGFRL